MNEDVLPQALPAAEQGGRLLKPEQAYVRYGMPLADNQRLLVLDRRVDGIRFVVGGIERLLGGLIQYTWNREGEHVVVMFRDLLDELSPELLARLAD